MSAPTARAGEAPPPPARDPRGTLRLVLDEGGPGFCQFAINNGCNARCGFCSFSLDRLPRHAWEEAPEDEALEAVDVLYRNGIRYLVITGGEPMLHPGLHAIVRRAAGLGMKVLLVTNGSRLSERSIDELRAAGLSSFLVSIDAADEATHEENRGLPGVCARIRSANRHLASLGMHATASVTMSRLVDYDALPGFLRSLGFESVTFSYPLVKLGSSFLGAADSDLVDLDRDELMAAFDRVKELKRRFRVVNPKKSLEEMQRFVRGEEQRYPCLGGFRYFYLDWKLLVWRCHFWEEPMCSIREFDSTQRIRDGCTRCMIDCYRDASLMQHVAVSVHDAWQSARAGSLGGVAKALGRRGNLASVRSVLAEVPWLLRF
jgi:MoaA/NifB/PqqE/SkfB family radical SAM enzyme